MMTTRKADLNARVATSFRVRSVKTIDCRARHGLCPPSDRDPRRRRGVVLAPDGCRSKGGHFHRLERIGNPEPDLVGTIGVAETRGAFTTGTRQRPAAPEP